MSAVDEADAAASEGAGERSEPSYGGSPVRGGMGGVGWEMGGRRRRCRRSGVPWDFVGWPRPHHHHGAG